MNRVLIGLLLLLGSLLPFSVYATPREIIIIRHADKPELPSPGPTLSAKGEIRALRFAFYFMEKFGEPDYILTTDPVNNEGKNSSIRALQTVAPLASLLVENHPKTGFPILHSYNSQDYGKLAKHLMEDKKFQGKRVLICWSHEYIPALAHELGIKQHIPKWPGEDFDTVYVLKYEESGSLKQFDILPAQYPVAFNGKWRELYNLVFNQI